LMIMIMVMMILVIGIIIYTLIYYLLSASNNLFPNIKLKCTTMQEIENIIKFLKPKNMCGYDEIPLLYLK